MPFLHPLTFLDPISSFTARGYCKFEENAYNWVVCPPKVTKFKTEKLPNRHVQTVKIS